MNIKFADNNTFVATETSTFSYMEFHFENFTAVDELAAEFNNEALHHVVIGEETFTRLIPLDFKAELVGETVVAVMTTRQMTTDEIRDEKIEELTDAVAELGDIIFGGAE